MVVVGESWYILLHNNNDTLFNNGGQVAKEATHWHNKRRTPAPPKAVPRAHSVARRGRVIEASIGLPSPTTQKRTIQKKKETCARVESHPSPPSLLRFLVSCPILHPPRPLCHRPLWCVPPLLCLVSPLPSRGGGSGLELGIEEREWALLFLLLPRAHKAAQSSALPSRAMWHPPPPPHPSFPPPAWA